MGGVVRNVIPGFRIPDSAIDNDVEIVKAMGAELVTGREIQSVEELKKDYDYVVLALGASEPGVLKLEAGEPVNALEFLAQFKATDGKVDLGKNVVVIGGGNTAMDSCRTAKRLGADVTLVYRRSEAEMPARLEEVKHAKEEGINFFTLHNPKEYEADEKGAVKAVVLDVMKLGEPDASGRRRPEATGETITLECDQVIVAVGVSPNPLVPQSIEGLELGRKNTIAVNDQMQSSIEEIYAGGDIVRGGATVILAMGDGRKAALNMSEKLLNKK